MTKIFSLLLPRHIHDEFYRCYPDRGARTALLRNHVSRLIRQAKAKGGVVRVSDLDQTEEDS